MEKFLPFVCLHTAFEYQQCTTVPSSLSGLTILKGSLRTILIITCHIITDKGVKATQKYIKKQSELKVACIIKLASQKKLECQSEYCVSGKCIYTQIDTCFYSFPGHHGTTQCLHSGLASVRSIQLLELSFFCGHVARSIWMHNTTIIQAKYKVHISLSIWPEWSRLRLVLFLSFYVHLVHLLT